jgi:hypothetical protein
MTLLLFIVFSACGMLTWVIGTRRPERSWAPALLGVGAGVAGIAIQSEHWDQAAMVKALLVTAVIALIWALGWARRSKQP